VSLIYAWPATFPDGYYARLSDDGMELLCGNVTGHHVSWRDWRVPPRATQLGPGRWWRWLHHGARTGTMVVPIDASRARRYVGSATGPYHETGDDHELVAGNTYDADGTGHWVSYLDGHGGTLRRVVADGRVLTGVTGRARGVAASAGQLLTTLDDAVLAVYDIETHDLVRQVAPRGTFNAATFRRGWIGHGYFGDAHVIGPDGQQWQANAYPGSREGVPVVEPSGPGGEPWAVTSVMHHDLSMGVLLRPVESLACIEIAGPRFAGLDAAYVPALRRFVVAGWGDDGALSLLWVDATAARGPVVPPVRPLGRGLHVGAFWLTNDRYGEHVPGYPHNVEVITEPAAVRRATQAVIVETAAIPGVTDHARVRGLYVAAEAEATPQALDEAVRHARATWRAAWPDVDVPPVCAYVPPGLAGQPGWPPQEPDVYVPEVYFDHEPTADRLATEMARWDSVLPQDRQWLLAAQAYDRNGEQAHWMPQLAAVSPAYIEACRHRPWVAGILWFAVNRPGGVRSYPELLPPHVRILAAVPDTPPRLERRPGPGPGGDMLKVHVGDYARTGKVGEPAAIDFRIESDHPVTEIRIDHRRDGQPGRVLKPGAELSDLRWLRGVKVVMEKAGSFSWHVGAKNSAGEPDESQSERTIVVDP
jgi:hypothetical protein